MLGRGEDHTESLQPVEIEELQRHQRVTDRPESIRRHTQDTRFERSGQVDRAVLPGERRQKASSAFDQREVGAGGVLADASNQIVEVDLRALPVGRFRWRHGLAESKQRVQRLCLACCPSERDSVLRLRQPPPDIQFRPVSRRRLGDLLGTVSEPGRSRSTSCPRRCPYRRSVAPKV